MIDMKPPKFSKAISRLNELFRFNPVRILEEHGQMGVQALSKATPTDTGATASGWSYKIVPGKERYKLIWSNSEVAGTTPIVILLQYGHATKSGYFLSGTDFINPAIKPVYTRLARKLGQEIKQ